MKFNHILRCLIEEHNITQKQLANNLNIAPSTIGNYVQGVREPDFETLKQLANYFNVNIDYLLDFQSGNIKTHDEDELLRIFRNMSKNHQKIFLEQGKAFISKNI